MNKRSQSQTQSKQKKAKKDEIDWNAFEKYVSARMKEKEPPKVTNLFKTWANEKGCSWFKLKKYYYDKLYEPSEEEIHQIDDDDDDDDEEEDVSKQSSSKSLFDQFVDNKQEYEKVVSAEPKKTVTVPIQNTKAVQNTRDIQKPAQETVKQTPKKSTTNPDYFSPKGIGLVKQDLGSENTFPYVARPFIFTNDTNIVYVYRDVSHCSLEFGNLDISTRTFKVKFKIVSTVSSEVIAQKLKRLIGASAVILERSRISETYELDEPMLSSIDEHRDPVLVNFVHDNNKYKGIVFHRKVKEKTLGTTFINLDDDEIFADTELGNPFSDAHDEPVQETQDK